MLVMLGVCDFNSYQCMYLLIAATAMKKWLEQISYIVYNPNGVVTSAIVHLRETDFEIQKLCRCFDQILAM